jgi:UDPglucose 6-dehydrogenase
VLWVALDTPVDENDDADVSYVRRRLEEVFASLPHGITILISSQVPVGFTRGLATEWRDRGRDLHFAYSPENLRLGNAIEAFREPERIVAGVDGDSAQAILAQLFASFERTGGPPRIEWVTVESAEMTKHALNSFLATSVSFANELARLCETVGADAKEVERSLKSDGRIGPRAYLAPGAAFAGGTLARDVRFLTRFGQRNHVETPLLSGVLESNDLHQDWVTEKINEILGSAREEPKVAAVLGLTYKPGTNTLRRSPGIELCRRLHEQGVQVRGHDPSISTLPEDLDGVLDLTKSAEEAITGADVAVIATEWPDYRSLTANDFIRLMRSAQVIDQGWFLAEAVASADLLYVATGRPSL